MTLDLKAIEERANKATPGPWVIVWSQLMEHHGAAFNPWRRVLVGLPKPEGAGKNVLTAKYVTEVTQLAQTDEQDAQAVSDGRFIAHAREDIPALVARVKELEAALLDIEPRLNDVREFVAAFEAIGDTEESCQRIALKDIGWIRQRISGALSPTESDTPL